MSVRLARVVHGNVTTQGRTPLLLASSLGTTHRLWDSQIAYLAARTPVVAFDHRGHGDSPAPAGTYCMDDLGADVVALLDELGLERVSVCGLSLGGMVGMWLAVNAPERVERLVLCCTSARLGPPEVWSQRRETVLEHGMEPIADAVIDRWYTPAFSAASRDVVTASRAMFLSCDPTGYAGCCGAIETMDLIDDLASISCPTTVIAGCDDLATPSDHTDLIVKSIPGAETFVVPGAHLANVESPDEVLSALASGLGLQGPT